MSQPVPLSGWALTSDPLMGHIVVFRTANCEIIPVNVSMKLQLHSLYERKTEKLDVIGTKRTG